MPFLHSVLYVLFCGMMAHVIGEAVPRAWFHADRFPYAPCKWEEDGAVYEKMGIQRWKDRLPDMSRVCKRMFPKRLDRFPTAERVERLIAETCVAEATHGALCLAAPVIWFFWRNYVGVILSGTVVICNLPFMMIQRYNRPKLVVLYKRLAAREEKKRNASTDFVR